MKYMIFTNHSYMLFRFRRELISRLLQQGEVVLVMPFVGHEEDFQAMGCRCIHTQLDRRSISPRGDLQLYRFYKKLLQQEKPDMVITYSIKPNIYAGFACRKLGIPYCANVQGLGTAFQKKALAMVVSRMYRTALKQVKTVFFENRENANVFIQRKLIPADKVTVVNGAGINLTEYPFCEYPGQEEVTRFLYLGRIMREKGMDELLWAIHKLHEAHPGKVQLDLVGFFEDAYKEQVEALAAEGIAKFHGFQPEPKPYYGTCHCVVLPSYHEGMSNVLLEAAATGRPVITSDIPGCRESVLPEVSGYLCRAKDRESLLEAMEQFMQLSYAQRQAMGLAGRQHMERNFDKNQIVEQTLAAIRQ